MASLTVSAQSDVVDTTIVKTSSKGRKYNLDVSFGRSEDSVKNASAPTGRFGYGLTFTRLDIGFSRLIDYGSFKLSPKNDFWIIEGLKQVLYHLI